MSDLAGHLRRVAAVDVVATYVRRELPRAVAGHGGHHAPTADTRITHQGHEILVSRTYHVAVDGRAFPLAVEVTASGTVTTHALPFETFASATDLMKALIAAYPDDFAEPQPASDHQH